MFRTALLGLVATAAVASLPTTADAKITRCAGVYIRNPDGSIYTKTDAVFAEHVSCKTARRIARSYMTRREGDTGVAPRPLGFRCSGGNDGVACKKGRRLVSWGYFFD